VVIIVEPDIGQRQPAMAFDPDLVRAIDHDLTYFRVMEKRFDWTEGQDIRRDGFEKARLFNPGQGDAFCFDQLVENLLDALATLWGPQVDVLAKFCDELALDAGLRLYRFGVGRGVLLRREVAPIR
jgi:hypothetical protein